ncbi:hypothetical protein QI045_12585 [Staphylococcus saprophyticus]|nr:hypothetical protein [Staphylococcus saprophyticus]
MAYSEEKFEAQIDLEVDKHKYLWLFKVKDIVIVAPFILLGIIICVVFSKYFGVNIFSSFGALVPIFAFIPALVVAVIIMVPATTYNRKNIYLIHEMLYKWRFNKRKKIYDYTNSNPLTKEDFMEDIISQLEIYNITKECYETLDDHLVKVIKVSTLNVTGLPISDQRKIYEGFEEFNKKLDRQLFPLQISNRTRPVNLDEYINECREYFANNDNYYDRLFGESYLEFTNDIQKNKKMVSKSPYVIIKRKISDKEDTAKVLEKLAERLKADIEDMLPPQLKLTAQILNNNELEQLYHYTIDYQNAKVVDTKNLGSVHDVTFAQEEREDFDKYWKERQKSTIL